MDKLEEGMKEDADKELRTQRPKPTGLSILRSYFVLPVACAQLKRD